MDLSKLPKLSQTPPPPAHDTSVDPASGKVELFCRCGAAITPGTKFCSNCGASYAEATGGIEYRSAPVGPPQVGMGAEAFISIAMGIILLLMAPRAWQWYLSRATFATNYNFTDGKGNPMAYTDTAFYWADLGILVFSIVLIFEGILMLLSKFKPLIMIGLVFTVLAVGLNLWVVAKTYGVIGFQILNALAAAFAVYIAIYQIALLKVRSR
jgi:hypothetical protein